MIILLLALLHSARVHHGKFFAWHSDKVRYALMLYYRPPADISQVYVEKCIKTWLRMLMKMKILRRPRLLYLHILLQRHVRFRVVDPLSLAFEAALLSVPGFLISPPPTLPPPSNATVPSFTIARLSFRFASIDS